MGQDWNFAVRGNPAPTGHHPIIKQQTKSEQTSAFEEHLRKELQVPQRVKISSHAQQRLDQRSIGMSSEDWDHVSAAIDKVAAKGGKETLLLHRNYALVVNVTNRTVITALDPNAMKEHVFTQIDSAVML